MDSNSLDDSNFWCVEQPETWSALLENALNFARFVWLIWYLDTQRKHYEKPFAFHSAVFIKKQNPKLFAWF